MRAASRPTDSMMILGLKEAIVARESLKASSTVVDDYLQDVLPAVLATVANGTCT
jgi:hypothetical protein